jgi:hypothetical protein
MLSLDVGGHGIGGNVAAALGDSLHVSGFANSAVPIEKLELIVNGDVVASAPAADGGRQAILSYELRAEESCWVALRAAGPRHELVLDPDGAFAHTSPVYISVAGAPPTRRDDAHFFVDWIDRLIAVTQARARFPSDGDRDSIIATFREGQSYYRALAGH